MVRASSRLTMTDSEREEQKILMKEQLSGEKGNAEDADNRLGEPYVTDNKTEREMLREECQQEMLPMYKGKPVKLDEIATSTESKAMGRSLETTPKIGKHPAYGRNRRHQISL